MSHLESLGFKIDSAEAFEALVSTIFEHGEEIAVEGGKYIAYRDASGATIYAQVEDEEFVGFMPFYDAEIRREIHIESIVSNDDLTSLDSRYLAKSQGHTYPFVFDVVNAKERVLDVPSTEILPFVAFPTEIEYFATPQEFIQEMPELSMTYFIPVGLMTPEGEANDKPEPYAMFISQIKSVELKRNSYSNQQFYVLEVSALEGDLTVVTSVKSLKSEPQVGAFINGVYWMGARV